MGSWLQPGTFALEQSKILKIRLHVRFHRPNAISSSRTRLSLFYCFFFVFVEKLSFLIYPLTSGLSYVPLASLQVMGGVFILFCFLRPVH